MNPTALELWYSGNYVGRWSIFEIFRKADKFYAVLPEKDGVVEMNDVDIRVALNH